MIAHSPLLVLPQVFMCLIRWELVVTKSATVLTFACEAPRSSICRQHPLIPERVQFLLALVWPIALMLQMLGGVLGTIGMPRAGPMIHHLEIPQGVM
jgi:hypothetical protein